MADPLSIIGAISSIVQLSQLVVGYIKAAKGAESDRQSLLAQVNATATLCQTLMDSAEIDAKPWMKTLQSISEEDVGPLISFRRTLEYLKTKLAPANRQAKDPVQSFKSSLKWPFETNSLREVLADIEKQKSLLALALANDNLKLSAAILKTSQDAAQTLSAMRTTQRMEGDVSRGISQGVRAIQIHQEAEDRESHEKDEFARKQYVISQLTNIDFEASHADISSRRVKNTGQWILKSLEYTEWRGKDSSTALWCPGLPGSGKTVLASVIIDSLRQLRDTDTGVAGIYCSYRTPDTTNALIGSVLRQLLKPSGPIPKNIEGAFKDSASVLATMKDVSTHYQRLYLVIDALDECANVVDFLKQLSRVFEMISVDCPDTKIHLLFTGRHNVSQMMKRYFGRHSLLEITSREEDVRRYLQQNFDDHDQLAEWIACDNEFETLIVDSILARLSGMFLLARLYMDILAHIPTKRGVRKVLTKLPKGYDDTYAEAWNRILAQRPQQAELGKRVLSWIVNATRPLRTQELQYALAVEEGDEELDREGLLDVEKLSSFCAGLVIVNEQSNLVTLVHPTTQEYFSNHKGDLFSRANEEIAAVCVTYLLMKPVSDGGVLTDPEAFRQRWIENPLLGYAAVNWGVHVRESKSELSTKISLSLLRSDQARLAASQALILNTVGTKDWGTEWPVLDLEFYDLARTVESQNKLYHVSLGPLHLASLFGLLDSLTTLLQQGHEVDEVDAMSSSPIHWALIEKQHRMLEYLLEQGSNPNAERQ